MILQKHSNAKFIIESIKFSTRFFENSLFMIQQN